MKNEQQLVVPQKLTPMVNNIIEPVQSNGSIQMPTLSEKAFSV